MRRINSFIKRNVIFVLWFLLALTLIHILVIWPLKAKLQDVYNAVNSILPFITIVLVYQTFKQQIDQVQKTQDQVDIAKSELENNVTQSFLNRVDQHFILSLQIHRDNVAAMNYENKKTGKEVFVQAFERFEKIFYQLYIVDRDDINAKLKVNLKKFEFIDIAYRILFYGIDMDMPTERIDNYLKKYNYLLKPDSEREWGFGGYIYGFWPMETSMQGNLANYFRHLYHTVTYIHDLNIGETEKKFYIKRVRGQFSNHELAIFFINSLSIGENWRKYKSDSNAEPVDLITTYELIKNLPGKFFEHINHKCYYRDVEYEEDAGIVFNKTMQCKHCHEKLPD